MKLLTFAFVIQFIIHKLGLCPSDMQTNIYSQIT